MAKKRKKSGRGWRKDSDLNNAQRVYPRSDCSCLWTLDNTGNQLSRISYPPLSALTPVAADSRQEKRSGMVFNEISPCLFSFSPIAHSLQFHFSRNARVILLTAVFRGQTKKHREEGFNKVTVDPVI